MKKSSKLRVGQLAPDFARADIEGNVVKLADYKNDKLLICFFRYAGCPWCNLAIHRLTISYPRLKELNLKVIAFVQSKPENIKKYIINRHQPSPPFPIIADPLREIYNMYGVDDSLPAAARSLVKIPGWLYASLGKGFRQTEIDGSLTLVPAQFLIEPGGQKIHTVNYGVDYYGSLPMVGIMDFAMFDSDKLLRANYSEI